MTIRRRDRVGGLPATAANFVGRAGELEKISLLLLEQARLVTLTGPGGIGKTRLAVEAVRGFSRAKSAPVYWVRLARLARDSDTAAVEEEIARSVVETDFSGRSAWELLIDTFTRVSTAGRQRRILLVLDNCEHVLVSAAVVISRLLDALPELTVVTTSREPIGWVDEHLIAVQPLAPRHAVALFRQQAELTGHPITGREQMTTAAEICRRVDNHPLYIQLAAARLRHQPLVVLLRGLTGRADDARLRWSHGPRFGADARHRGVSDVITWSYELCTEEERVLFDRMSVFAAGYDTDADEDGSGASVEVGVDLEAIEVVCGDGDPSGPGEPASPGSDARSAVEEIEELLESLVDHSLVTAHITPTTVRYSLVETLRVYAQQRLRERSSAEIDEPARLAQRHLRYYRDKIAYAAAHWFHSDGQHGHVSWARSAWADTLTAIENSLADGRADIGLEICLGLISLRMPFIRGSLREMRQWTQRCLDAARAPTTKPTERQIEAMAAIAWLALTQGDHEYAARVLDDCVAACLADETERQNWRQMPERDIGLPAAVEFTWAMELLFVRRDARAITVFTRARAAFDAAGNAGSAALSELYAAMAAGLLGTGQQALELTERFLESARASAAPRAESWAEHARAIALTKHGDPGEAMRLERSSLAYKFASGDLWGAMWVVECRTWSLARVIADALTTLEVSDRDRLVAPAIEIAHLAGGVEALRTKLGVDIGKLGPYADESAKAVEVARRILGPDRFIEAKARGARLRPEDGDVQRLALGTLVIEAAPREKIREAEPTGDWLQLTATEQQVATLAAAGWTNPAIAARRGSSVRTVDAQVASILQKLVLTTREDIIEKVPRSVISIVGIEAARRPRRGKG
ncbi:LuxR C-terminal-related transcriptional regulator [Nocardia sp. NPDC047654]|uniref:LuxR C-terminal-related transcriptional regulator n=1 Tax=Nocardia sp. NPDC047654 TaxID=3364314 RepID=UPI003724203C